MEVRNLQAALNARGGTKPLLAVDGIAGKRTMALIDELLKDVDADSWSDARKLIAAEQIVYQHAVIEVGAIDGLVGEQTRYARTVYAARLAGDKTVETWRDKELAKPVTNTPAVHPSAKWPRQSSMEAFFGERGSNQVTLELPFPMRVAWEPSKTVTRFSCHAKVEAPMQRIWQRTLDHYTFDGLKKLRLDMFGGCLNVRKMRGGSAWSIHSWGCAVDTDPDRNQLKFNRAQAALDDAPYKPFWGFINAEGAIGLGPERDFDWMHWQFARL